MNYLTLLLSFFILSGCGQQFTSTVPLKSQSGTGVSASWISVQIQKPASNNVGSAITVMFNGRPYLVGALTPQNILNNIQSIPAGTSMTKEVVGTFSREKGHFPNPSAEVDVINISQIK